MPIIQSAAKLILIKFMAPITLVTNLLKTRRTPQQKRAKKLSIRSNFDDVGSNYGLTVT
jgi:hypothetical protein